MGQFVVLDVFECFFTIVLHLDEIPQMIQRIVSLFFFFDGFTDQSDNGLLLEAKNIGTTLEMAISSAIRAAIGIFDQDGVGKRFELTNFGGLRPPTVPRAPRQAVALRLFAPHFALDVHVPPAAFLHFVFRESLDAFRGVPPIFAKVASIAPPNSFSPNERPRRGSNTITYDSKEAFFPPSSAFVARPFFVIPDTDHAHCNITAKE